MNLKYDIITQEAAKRGWSVAYLVERLGMSRKGFDQMILAKTMKVSTLEKLCEVFGVGVTYFFEDNAGVSISGEGVTQIGNIGGQGGKNIIGSTMDSDKDKEIATLKQKIELQEQLILSLKENITLLRQMLNK